MPNDTNMVGKPIERGHFTVRRLEQVYGKSLVRTEYERLAQDH
jgi:hypothetical protein